MVEGWSVAELAGRVSRLVQRDIVMTMLHGAYLFRALR
jgi:hypothetical protein